MAKTQDPNPIAQAAAAPVLVRVLTACPYGQPNDVAEVLPEEVDIAKQAGLVDDDPAAVEYARSLVS